MGNPLTVDDERRKLALVVETAQEVWGDTVVVQTLQSLPSAGLNGLH